MSDLVLSHDSKVINLPTADIGGTNTAAIDTTYWAPCHDMAGYAKVYAKVMLGPTWNASDDLDTIKLQQCDSASVYTNVKDLTTSGAGATYGYNTTYPIDAAANTVVLEARAEDFDMDNGFHYVRVYGAEGGNTGTDEISGVLILYGAVYEGAEQEAAASEGAVVYVKPIA